MLSPHNHTNMMGAETEQFVGYIVLDEVKALSQYCRSLDSIGLANGYLLHIKSRLDKIIERMENPDCWIGLGDK